MKNIEPRVYRQRLIIEARHSIEINQNIIKKFLSELSKTIDMTPLLKEPFVFYSKQGKPGYQGVVFWTESGALLYTWDDFNLITIDTYSCKTFQKEKVIELVKEFFKTTELEHQEI